MGSEWVWYGPKWVRFFDGTGGKLSGIKMRKALGFKQLRLESGRGFSEFKWVRFVVFIKLSRFASRGEGKLALVLGCRFGRVGNLWREG
jgi:hypothetical protein